MGNNSFEALFAVFDQGAHSAAIVASRSAVSSVRFVLRE